MKLINNLPGYYRKSVFVQELYTVIEAMFELSDDEWKTFVKNMFATQAVDISQCEKDVGIEPDPSIDLEIRRANVLNRIRGNGILTVERLKELVESYEPTGVKIIEKFKERTIKLYFENCIGTPEHYDEMINAIDDVKPAYIVVECVLRLLTWGEVKEHIDTWEDVKNKCQTWGDLLQYDYMKG